MAEEEAEEEAEAEAEAEEPPDEMEFHDLHFCLSPAFVHSSSSFFPFLFSPLL